MMGWFRRRAPAYAPMPEPLAPPGSRIYAIGDIHGRLDLLEDLHRRILDDAATAADKRRVIVYLGDYVDRGLNSREVIDTLLDRPLPGFEPVHLLGNHEAILMQFMEDAAIAPAWFNNGGTMALYSYGIQVPPSERDEAKLRAAQAEFVEKLPRRHLQFLRGLRTSHVEGDYFFAHAGIKPGVALDKQDPRDLIWIRAEFLESRAAHPKTVVHGHSVDPNVQILPNRIGIDTGAYYTGRLTAAVFEGGLRRFINT